MSYKSLFSLVLIASAVPAVAGDSITGTYLETRTCQVYTGPCFANAETALTGRDRKPRSADVPPAVSVRAKSRRPIIPSAPS